MILRREILERAAASNFLAGTFRNKVHFQLVHILSDTFTLSALCDTYFINKRYTLSSCLT